MTTRRRAREIVVQLLYEDDLNPEQSKSVARKFLAARLNNNKRLIEFSEGLWENVLKNRWDLDKAISAKAANWSIRRMAAIDRNILRLGGPPVDNVAIDEEGQITLARLIGLVMAVGMMGAARGVAKGSQRSAWRWSLPDWRPALPGSCGWGPATGRRRAAESPASSWRRCGCSAR